MSLFWRFYNWAKKKYIKQHYKDNQPEIVYDNTLHGYVHPYFYHRDEFFDVEILAEYLPKQLSQEELTKIIEEVIKETGATTMKDMGIVMKTVKEKVGAQSDGKTINEIVKSKLN